MPVLIFWIHAALFIFNVYTGEALGWPWWSRSIAFSSAVLLLTQFFIVWSRTRRR